MSDKAQICVIVATYNGEKYIWEQLLSLLNQSSPIDQVLISDDGSIDDTIKIVNNFIRHYKLNNKWTLLINEKQLGYAKNFLYAIRKCKGNIICYCDQDDIWEKDKIKYIRQAFNQINNLKACCCRYLYVDDNNDPVNTTNLKFISFKKSNNLFQHVTPYDYIKYFYSPGMCLAFSKDLIINNLDYICSNNLTHDLTVGLIASFSNGYYVINRELVRYRQHSNNTSAPRITIKSRFDINKQIEGREGRLHHMKKLAFLCNFENKKDLWDDYFNAIDTINASIQFLKNNNSFQLFKQLFNKNPMLNRYIAINNFICSVINQKKEPNV